MPLPVSKMRPLLLSAAILVAACSNRASTFVAAPEAGGDDAVVYLYRPAASANFMMSPRVVIDEQAQFAIANGDYRYVYLDRGDHVVSLSATDRYQAGAPLALSVEAGKSYYLRVSTSLKFEPEKMNTRRFWLDVVDGKQALIEIANTDYAGPPHQQASSGEPGEPEHTPEFSVDRTQDPFAGKYE